MQRPPIFEASDGFFYVLKLDTADRDFPAAELVAAGLAESLGVPLPAFRVLVAPEVLTNALAATGEADHMEFAASFRRMQGTCFGSRYLDGVTVKWDTRLRRRVDAAERVLAALFVFDAFIENGDRSSATNPNLLVSNGRLFAIDHGQSLPSVQGHTGKSLPFPFDSHLAWGVVSEHPALLEEPVARLQRLPDATIDAAIAAVPPVWWTDPSRPEAVRSALRRRREQLPATLHQLMERSR